ncbi:MAG: hypothetical protein KDH88_19710 [Chromatiales bacterium]|nr:hypothetical protein [Chromatiales bacterium]
MAEELGEQTASPLEALEKANAYSFGKDSINIGIIMSYGTKNTVTAEQVGDAFVAEFRKRGVSARYYYYNTNRDGMAMSYRIGYTSLGPWNVDKAAQHVSEAVRMVEAAQRIHHTEPVSY